MRPRLSTSCSRFPKKVAQKLLEQSQKLLFLTKAAQTFLQLVCYSFPIFSVFTSHVIKTKKIVTIE